MDLFSLGFVMIIGIVIGFTIRSQKNSKLNADTLAESKHVDEKSEHTARLYDLAERMNRFFEKSAHPKDLLGNDIFLQGVSMLASDQYSDERLIEYYAGSNVLIGCMALEAMHSRSISEATVDQIIFHLNSRYIWSLFFAYTRGYGGHPHSNGKSRNRTPKPIADSHRRSRRRENDPYPCVSPTIDP